MSDSYLVVAPYVTLPIHDVNGAEVVLGYYAGAVVSDPVKGDVLDKHVRQGLVKTASAKETFGPGAEAPVVEAPAKSRGK